MKAHWNKVVEKTFEGALVFVAAAYVTSSVAATTCQTAGSILPVSAHDAVCSYADIPKPDMK